MHMKRQRHHGDPTQASGTVSVTDMAFKLLDSAPFCDHLYTKDQRAVPEDKTKPNNTQFLSLKALREAESSREVFHSRDKTPAGGNTRSAAEYISVALGRKDD